MKDEFGWQDDEMGFEIIKRSTRYTYELRIYDYAREYKSFELNKYELKQLSNLLKEIIGDKE